jgi:hypothetical protein
VVLGSLLLDTTNQGLMALLPADCDSVDCYVGCISATLPIPYGTKLAISGKLKD